MGTAMPYPIESQLHHAVRSNTRPGKPHHHASPGRPRSFWGCTMLAAKLGDTHLLATHQLKPSDDFTCVICGSRMVLRKPKTAVPHFAHHPSGDLRCVGNTETHEHHAMKNTVLSMFQDRDNVQDVTITYTEDDPVPPVLITFASGRQVAVECLVDTNEESVRARLAAHSALGIHTLHLVSPRAILRKEKGLSISTAHARWRHYVPSWVRAIQRLHGVIYACRGDIIPVRLRPWFSYSREFYLGRLTEDRTVHELTDRYFVCTGETVRPDAPLYPAANGLHLADFRTERFWMEPGQYGLYLDTLHQRASRLVRWVDYVRAAEDRDDS